MAILTVIVNGEEKRLEVYSIDDLLQIIGVKQQVIEALAKENAKLRRIINGEVNGMDQEGGKPGSATGG